jgi:hypothetical protein
MNYLLKTSKNEMDIVILTLLIETFSPWVFGQTLRKRSHVTFLRLTQCLHKKQLRKKKEWLYRIEK